MNWTYVILMFGFIWHQENFVNAVTTVSLSTTYNNAHEIVLACEVKDSKPIDLDVRLFCSVTKENICYHSCYPYCKDQPNCSNTFRDCNEQHISPNHLIISWTIDMSNFTQKNNWYCNYMAQKSEQIEIRSRSKPITNQSTSKNRFIEGFSKTSATTTTITHSNSFQSSKITKSILKNESKIYPGFLEFWNYLKHPNVVLILFCCIVFSVLLNIAFIIRCLVVKIVLERHTNPTKTRYSCLTRCFCLNLGFNNPNPNNSGGQSQLARPPSALIKSPSQNQNSRHSQSSYLKEDLYEPGLSIGSQFNRSLLQSNLSQYELLPTDQYNTSFYSSNKIPLTNSDFALKKQQICCHNSTPVGNYVVVMGSNINDNSNKNQQFKIHDHNQQIPGSSSDYSSWSVASQEQYTRPNTTELMMTPTQASSSCSTDNYPIYSVPNKCKNKTPFKNQLLNNTNPPILPPKRSVDIIDVNNDKCKEANKLESQSN